MHCSGNGSLQENHSMNYSEDIKNCIWSLRNGGTILYPTDTIWGIGCDAADEQAVTKIYTLKKRTEEKSMIILLADENEIKNYAAVPSEEIKSVLHFSGRPVTVIYPGAKNLAKNIISADGSIAIRIVQDEFCCSLINAFGGPVVSTSANISGEAFTGTYHTISAEIKQRVDYIAHHRREDKNPSAPSRILKWTEDKGLIVIRE